jgi:hypothetical protein
MRSPNGRSSRRLMMFARIGLKRALNRHQVREFNPARKEPHWRRRKATGCDLVHILDPKMNDSLELMVQINSNNEVGSCPPYSTSFTANTAVPASPKCGNNF